MYFNHRGLLIQIQRPCGGTARSMVRDLVQEGWDVNLAREVALYIILHICKVFCCGSDGSGWQFTDNSGGEYTFRTGTRVFFSGMFHNSPGSLDR